MSVKQALIPTVLATLALAVALALAGADRGMALYAYVLFIGAIALLALTRGVRSALPETRPLDDLVRRPPPVDERMPQIEALTRWVGAGQASSLELHHRLRPVVREIAAARLVRNHGVDLERQPDAARVLVGERTWELVRPDRTPPEERFARGWSTRQLDALVDELEEI